jgi:AmiR/NasT family two-component response regulator
MRAVLLRDGVEPKELWPAVHTAEDAFQRSRALNARLGMRPHADRALVEKAEASSESMLDAIKAARGALIRRHAAKDVTGQIPSPTALDGVMTNIEAGYARAKEYEALACVAIDKLLG